MFNEYYISGWGFVNRFGQKGSNRYLPATAGYKEQYFASRKMKGDPDIAGQARFEYNSTIFIKTIGFNHTGDQ
jgi:hypothetical protein